MTNDKYLVDTSIWINALRRDGNVDARRWLRNALLEEKVFIAPPVKTEILAGAINKKQFQELKNELNALPLLNRHNEVWEYTAGLNFTLRRKGVNIPIMDALVASWAIVHECILVHYDRHFQLVENVDKKLLAISIPSLDGN